MAQRLRTALVGLGRRGRGAHLPIYARLQETFELVAVCDKDEAVAQAVAGEVGVNAYTSLQALVAQESLDVADVVVPGDAHHAICCYLAEAGVHTIVETPIAPTGPMADLMIQAAERNGVKLEVAENYHRTARARFQAKVIEAGVIGDVSRIYRIFYEGGYHGMSMLRLLAGSAPRSILGITHNTPVVPIVDRKLRHHTQEHMTTSHLEFENGVAAIMIYSNVIHARSLGRKQTGISQIDGTRGAIVDGTVYYTAPDEYAHGAVATGYTPQLSHLDVDGVQVLEQIVLELPTQTITWRNPYAQLGIGANNGRGIDMADQLLSLAHAVQHDTEPTYGAAAARLDQEMNLAAAESARNDKQPVHFPLASPAQVEEEYHAYFADTYGHVYTEIEPLVDVFYPRQ